MAGKKEQARQRKKIVSALPGFPDQQRSGKCNQVKQEGGAKKKLQVTAGKTVLGIIKHSYPRDISGIEKAQEKKACQQGSVNH